MSREAFEKQFPTPIEAVFNERRNEYVWRNYPQTYHMHNDLWLAWQAALESQPQVPEGWEIVRADNRHISVKHHDGTWTTIQDTGPLNNLMFYELCLALTASQEQENGK